MKKLKTSKNMSKTLLPWQHSQSHIHLIKNIISSFPLLPKRQKNGLICLWQIYAFPNKALLRKFKIFHSQLITAIFKNYFL